MVRKIGAVVAGILTLGAVVITIQQIATSIHPLPPGLDPMDPDNAQAFRAHLETMPPSAWAAAFLSEVLGAFCGALVGGWVARDAWRSVSSFVVGLALVGSVSNWVAFEHPDWFIVGQIFLYPLALAGAWSILARRAAKSPAEATAP